MKIELSVAEIRRLIDTLGWVEHESGLTAMQAEIMEKLIKNLKLGKVFDEPFSQKGSEG